MPQKIMFVHIAKAAGSSVNRFFADHYNGDQCVVHLESQRDILENNAILSEKDFVSGHITYREFKTKLDIDKYFVITCLREPVSHVISHLAWIRKLAEPSEIRRFENHPPYIQKLATKMSSVDFNSPIEIHDFIEKLEPAERRLLDNVQVNYLHSCNTNCFIGQAELESAISMLDEIDLAGVVEHLDLFFRLLSDRLELVASQNAVHENTQSNKYGMSSDNLEFQAAVEPLIKYDRILYQKVKENFLALKMKDDAGKIHPAIIDASNSTVKGNLDLVSPKLIHGWCMRLDSTLPARVALYINNEEVATADAITPRKDVHLKGIHPTGLCGFRFLPENQFVLHAGDLVSVKVIGDNAPIELRNSPKILKDPHSKVVI